MGAHVTYLATVQSACSVRTDFVQLANVSTESKKMMKFTSAYIHTYIRTPTQAFADMRRGQ